MFTSAGEKLPPEIIEAIFYRLPVKSVGRFKSVSKRWRSLISDPTFIKTHLHLNRFHQTTKSILLSNIGGPIYILNINQLLPYLNSSDNTDIEIPATAKELSLGSYPIEWDENLGSCNGLVLKENVKGRMFLMNPTTITQEQELWEVPPTPFRYNTDREFDTCWGFGYDLITDDYKFVCISYPKHNNENLDTYVSLYSLRNKSWKKLPNPPRVIIKEFSGALVNHNYHWLAGSTTTEVIVFSFADEVFSEIKLPNVLKLYPKVVEIGGKLGLWNGCELWVMHEYGNNMSWTKVFSHQFTNIFRPLYLVEGSNRYIVLQDLTEHEVVVFSIDERRCRNVRIVGGAREFFHVQTFVESIESSKRIITTH